MQHSAFDLSRKRYAAALTLTKRGFHTPAPVAAHGGQPPHPRDIWEQMKGLAVELGQVRNLPAQAADAVQQVQPVTAQDFAIGVDLHGGEEGVDGVAQ